MSVESITSEQQSIAASAKDHCMQGKSQAQSQAIVEESKKTKETADAAQQQLATLPYEIVNQAQNAIETLMGVINGYQNPSSPDFNAGAVIGEVTAAVSPVISMLASLPAPALPGLPNITSLMTTLGALNQSTSNGTSADPNGQLPQINEDIIKTIEDLIASLESLCTALPLALISVIFQMLNSVILMFQQVTASIGVPAMTLYPLTLAPSCIPMMQSFIDFAIKTPVKAGQAARNIMQKNVKAAADMQFPDFPEDVEEPAILPPCPQRDA